MVMAGMSLKYKSAYPFQYSVSIETLYLYVCISQTSVILIIAFTAFSVVHSIKKSSTDAKMSQNAKSRMRPVCTMSQIKD